MTKFYVALILADSSTRGRGVLDLRSGGIASKHFFVLPGVLTFLFVAAVFTAFAEHWFYTEIHHHISEFVWWL